MRQPFELNVGEALRHRGQRISLDLVGPLAGVALSSARVPDDADVRFQGVVEAQGAQVIVQGVAQAHWIGECRRCLGPTEGEVVVDIQEVFEETPVEGETFLLDSEEIDLEPLLRESLALGLPLAPLCSDDCVGPDPEEHPVRPGEEPTSVEPGRDPRWAALDQLNLD